MRHAYAIPLLLVLIGCGTTPRARWAEQRALLSAAQDSLVELHKANVISDKDFLRAHGMTLIARRYLEEARQFFDEGTGEATNTEAFEKLLITTRNLVNGLQTAIIQFSQAPGPDS